MKTTGERLEKRMVNEMGLTHDEAVGRIEGNDHVNAKFIKENVDLTKLETLVFE